MIVTLSGFTPQPRTDQPWTHARIDEAPAEAGPYGTIATLPLEPIDADPSHPAARDFTSTAAALEHGWYRVTFLDAEGGEEPTDPVPGDYIAAGMLASVEDVRLYLVTQGTVAPGAEIDERLLWRMLNAASWRMRDERPERTLAPDPPSLSAPPLERPFPARGLVHLPDLRELAEVRLDGRILEASEYTLARRRPTDPAIYLRLVNRRGVVGRELVVSGHWGPISVRPNVQEACIVWVARVFHQRTARFADNQADPEGGVLGYFRNLPPDVKVVLDSLMVPGL